MHNPIQLVCTIQLLCTIEDYANKLFNCYIFSFLLFVFVFVCLFLFFAMMFVYCVCMYFQTEDSAEHWQCVCADRSVC